MRMGGRSSARGITGVFLFIILFLVVFPFVALPLRYQVGGVLSAVIDGIGRFSLLIGVVFLIIAFAEIIKGRVDDFAKHIVIGVVLLWVGCMCTGIAIDIFGFIIGSGSSGGSGYH
jgi:hypothetical protein